MDKTVYSLQNMQSQRFITIHYSVYFFLSLFVLNETIRSTIQSTFTSFNLLFLIISIACILFYFIKQRILVGLFYLASFASMIVMINSIFFLHYDSRQLILTITSVLIPLYLVSIQLTKDEALHTLGKFLFFFNILIIALFCFGLVDYVTNRYLQLEMASTIFVGKDLSSLIYNENLSNIYRLYSFMGHPLTNAKYFLCFFILNFIYSSKKKTLLPPYLIILITAIGLLLSGSKTALFLFLFLLLFVYQTKYRFLYYIGIVVLLFFLSQSSLFQDNLLQRFTTGIENNDVSSGRNDLIEQLLKEGKELPNVLFGKGENYSRIVAQSFHDDTQNFEYPLLMLSYDYGLVAVGIIYFLCFLYPAYLLLKKKEYRILCYFLIWSLMINSYNAMANLGNDTFAQVCFITLIIQSLVNDGREEI
ncbi:hypothetical protein QUF88_10285 [Bacillus sp. DX1.1]|uniref:hypothetical protein n=1 Tax=unclassified Bacillus (in: firmicutes) TaxID=185979 RepID=UPI00257010CA|nr:MULTISPECIES: hypothetical protein [unclassified Bacillus (in: firmicutes)]MDM5154210.1 hypothetical protein [Bacillus sp. DX1.1]WJE83130.1 hypothetical protein QRE67_07790 [Bacillus sp. DX3.1]